MNTVGIQYDKSLLLSESKALSISIFATLHRIGNSFETKYGEVWHYGESQEVNWQCELQRNSEDTCSGNCSFYSAVLKSYLNCTRHVPSTLFSENYHYKLEEVIVT